MLESLLKLLYGVDSLVMMVNRKTKFPALALLAIATFLKIFHHALDNMDAMLANMRDLPVVRPGKGAMQASATSPQASAPSPVVLPNRQVFLARLLRQAMVHCPSCAIASPMTAWTGAAGLLARSSAAPDGTFSSVGTAACVRGLSGLCCG
jgi:hypothetical protein